MQQNQKIMNQLEEMTANQKPSKPTSENQTPRKMMATFNPFANEVTPPARKPIKKSKAF